MSFQACKKCNNFQRWPAGHVCLCKPFTVINDDGDDFTYHAHTPEGAALKHAEWSNLDGDYHLMDDVEEITVDGEKFRISAEQDISYTAKALTDGD